MLHGEGLGHLGQLGSTYISEKGMTSDNGMWYGRLLYYTNHLSPVLEVDSDFYLYYSGP